MDCRWGHRCAAQSGFHWSPSPPLQGRASHTLLPIVPPPRTWPFALFPVPESRQTALDSVSHGGHSIWCAGWTSGVSCILGWGQAWSQAPRLPGQVWGSGCGRGAWLLDWHTPWEGLPAPSSAGALTHGLQVPVGSPPTRRLVEPAAQAVALEREGGDHGRGEGCCFSRAPGEGERQRVPSTTSEEDDTP